MLASDVDDKPKAARLLSAVLADPLRAGEARLEAARSLIRLGWHHHRAATDGLLELLWSDDAPWRGIHVLTMGFEDLGSGPRKEVVETLCTAALHPDSPTDRLWKAVTLADRLGHRCGAELSAALWTVIEDVSEDPEVRGHSAAALARVSPDHLAELTDVVLALRDNEWTYSWRSVLQDPMILSADLEPSLRGLLDDSTLERTIRGVAAYVLAQVYPDLATEAISELRCQAADEFLEFQWRTDAVSRLAELDHDTARSAVEYHRSVVEDERKMITNRLDAAYWLARLDRSAAHLAMAALRRFAAGPEFTAAERADAVRWLAYLSPARMNPEVSRLALAAIRDPFVPDWQRGQLIGWLTTEGQFEVERTFLADRTIPLPERIPTGERWRHQTLSAQVEDVIREVLTAIETSPAQRVAAAAALAALSRRFVPEAAALLTEMSDRGCAARAARLALAKLGRTHRHKVIADAKAVVADESRPWRERGGAVDILQALMSHLPEWVLDHLRDLRRCAPLSDEQRVEVMYALRQADGLDAPRALRDDDRARPATRRKVANRLRDHAIEDRAAGARALHAVATDPTCRAALRWRAASDLTRLFGARGWEWGAAALREIAYDTTLPLVSRVDAARVLGEVRPDLRAEVIRFLRTLRNTGRPLPAGAGPRLHRDVRARRRCTRAPRHGE